MSSSVPSVPLIPPAGWVVKRRSWCDNLLCMGDDITGAVIGAAIEVHRTLGPGLLESVYEECLCRELELRSILFDRQKALPLTYKGKQIDCGYRLDIVVGHEVVVELKACNSLEPIHEAQLLTYLRLTGIKVGLLINFNVPVLRDGIRRLVI
jgi:GxxExxY protein